MTARTPRENLDVLRALAAEERRLYQLQGQAEREPEGATLPPADEGHEVRRWLLAKGLLVPARVPGVPLSRLKGEGN